MTNNTKKPRWLLLCFPVAALWLLSRAVPAPPVPTTPAAPVTKAGRTMPNVQITKGGAAVNVPVTGTTAPNSGAAWQVFDPSGVLADNATGSGNGSPGINGLFEVGNIVTGTPNAFPVQAFSGATPGVGYTYRCNTLNGPQSGTFDVVAGGGSVKTVTGLKQFGGATSVDRLKVSATAAHAPQLTLRHGGAFGTWTAITAPTPTQDPATATLWHWDVALSPAVADTLFEAVVSSAAGTTDAVRVTDFRAFAQGGELGGGSAPATPTGLSGIAGSGQATLSWDAENDTSVQGYTVTQNGVSIPVTGATLAGGRYTLVVTGLTNGTPYAFRVAAYSTNGASPFSPPVSVTPGAAPSALSLSLLSPADAATLQGLIPIVAQVDGGTGGVAKVELFVQGVLVDTQTAVATQPDRYTLTWDSRPSANGTYSLLVKATDRAATPNTVTATLALTAQNPSALATSYWYGAAETPQPGKAIREFLATCDITPTDDPRSLRQIVAGYRLGGATGGFEQNYTTLPLNRQQALTGGADTLALAVKMASRYVVSPFTLTGGVRKILAYGDGTNALVWTTDNSLWLFDGVSTPTLHLDATAVLTSGETLNDVARFSGRTVLAISGGASPVTNRLHEFDPATGNESYSLYVLPSAPNALCVSADGGTLYAGTAAGRVHTLSSAGTLQIAVGRATALPHAVTQLFPLALGLTNATPGVGIALSDGSLWDIDATETAHGARQSFAPNGTTETATNCAAVVGATKYLGTGAGGDLMALGGALSTYQAVFTAPAAIVSAAAFAGTLYFAVAGDARLWAVTLTPAPNTLAYSPVIDALPGVTAITSLFALGGRLYLGTTGGANNLYQYQAPTQDANAVYGRSIFRPGAAFVSFA